MRKYRIIETSKTVGDRIEKSYIIQYKKFWLWSNYESDLVYHTDTDYSVYCPYAVAFVSKIVIEFDCLESAKNYLNRLKNRYDEMYKKQRIVELFYKNSLKSVFVNRSCYRLLGSSFGYEYADSLEELVTKIDKRMPIVSTKVITV